MNLGDEEWQKRRRSPALHAMVIGRRPVRVALVLEEDARQDPLKDNVRVATVRGKLLVDAAAETEP